MDRSGDSIAGRGTSLVVQWLKLCTPNAGGPGSIPGQGTRPHIKQIRVCMPQLRLVQSNKEIKIKKYIYLKPCSFLCLKLRICLVFYCYCNVTYYKLCSLRQHKIIHLQFQKSGVLKSRYQQVCIPFQDSMEESISWFPQFSEASFFHYQSQQHCISLTVLPLTHLPLTFPFSNSLLHF